MTNLVDSYEGKSNGMLNGRKTVKITFDILMAGENMLNPFLMLNKSARIKQITGMNFKVRKLL